MALDVDIRGMRKPLFIVALLGLIVSGYLLFEYVSGGPILCGVNSSGCDTVRNSPYAYFLGIPTPLFGVLFYICLAVGALMITEKTYKLVRMPLTLLTGIGLAFSLWLTYLEKVVIHAWCTWCLASALLSVIAFYFVWHRMPKHAKKLNY